MTASCGVSRFPETQDGAGVRDAGGVTAKNIAEPRTIGLDRHRVAFIPAVIGYCSQEFAPWLLRLANIDGGFQSALALEGVGDQAEFLCAFEQLLGFLLINCGRFESLNGRVSLGHGVLFLVTRRCDRAGGVLQKSR